MLLVVGGKNGAGLRVNSDVGGLPNATSRIEREVVDECAGKRIEEGDASGETVLHEHIAMNGVHTHRPIRLVPELQKVQIITRTRLLSGKIFLTINLQ